MAYTNAIYYINLASGSDAARTALTSCIASNPSGTITRITKTAHGLVTGAVVDLTLFTTWLNAAFKITVVDANSFDLDATTWQATADADGTVTPRGGMNWTDAWLTFTTGATAARLATGDTLRIAKTADEVSLGQNATWTDGSQTVTLTTAVTKKIEDAIVAWTPSTNVTSATTNIRKIGATSTIITPSVAFTTGKLAYRAIAGGGTQDFSGYQYLNLWYQTNIPTAAGTYKLCLCSDTTGDTIVNEVLLPSQLANTSYTPVSINYGAALGASIQSVAIYCVIDAGADQIRINNIFASNGDISLKTLIGKTGDTNYNIQSIDGVTIKIDSNNTTSTGRGYSGTSSTQTLYYQVPYEITTTGIANTLTRTGNRGAGLNICSGGWNTSTNLRDGMTVFASTLAGIGTVFSATAGWRFENFKFARFQCIMSAANNTEYSNIVFAGGSVMLLSNSIIDVKILNCYIYNCSGSLSFNNAEIYYINTNFYNNTSSALSTAIGNYLLSCIFANNGAASISVNNTGTFGTSALLLRNCTLSDATEFSFNVFSIAYSFNHDNTLGNHWAFHNGATVNWQTTVFQGTDPGAWRTVTSSTTRTSTNPIPIKIAEVACAASALVTVKVWVKKDHATNIAAAIYVEDALYNIAGVVASEVTKANDTSWEELTLTFTPTEAGVVPIFAKTYYIAGNSNSYIGSVTITQA